MSKKLTRESRKLSEDWTVKKTFDESRKTHYQRYFYKNKKAAILKIGRNNRRVEQTEGYSMIFNDLKRVGIWMNKFEQIRKTHQGPIPDDDSDELLSLVVAASTFYYKCFSQTKGRKTQLNKNIVGKKHLILHKEFMEFRNDFSAHVGEGDWESAKVEFILCPGHDANYMRINVEASQIVIPKPMDETLEMVEEIKNSVGQKIADLHTQLYEMESKEQKLREMAQKQLNV